MKPKHQRLALISVSVVFLCIATLLVMQAFKENLVYFFSPSDIAAATLPPDQKIRLGGLVKVGSLAKGEPEQVMFILTDGAHEINVNYRGMLPNLFREGQGVVAEGTLAENGIFNAQSILAKHDENYMPKEVADSLKKSGHWEADYGK